jgi:hypothetical protein
MPMHTVTPLIADTDRAVATFVIRLVEIRTGGIVAGLTGRESVLRSQRGVVIRSSGQSSDRSITMLIQNNRGSFHIPKRDQPPHSLAVEATYRVPIPFHLLEERDNLVERVIQFAFDTLAMHRLELRVYGAD